MAHRRRYFPGISERIEYDYFDGIIEQPGKSADEPDERRIRGWIDVRMLLDPLTGGNHAGLGELEKP